MTFSYSFTFKSQHFNHKKVLVKADLEFNATTIIIFDIQIYGPDGRFLDEVKYGEIYNEIRKEIITRVSFYDHIEH